MCSKTEADSNPNGHDRSELKTQPRLLRTDAEFFALLRRELVGHGLGHQRLRSEVPFYAAFIDECIKDLELKSIRQMPMTSLDQLALTMMVDTTFGSKSVARAWAQSPSDTSVENSVELPNGAAPP